MSRMGLEGHSQLLCTDPSQGNHITTKEEGVHICRNKESKVRSKGEGKGEVESTTAGFRGGEANERQRAERGVDGPASEQREGEAQREAEGHGSPCEQHQEGHSHSKWDSEGKGGLGEQRPQTTAGCHWRRVGLPLSQSLEG